MSALFLPYNILFARVDNIVAPDYPVDIAQSSARIETRTLIVDKPSEATMSVVVDNETDLSMGALFDFYQVTKGKHRSFTIPQDHNLYDLIPEFARSRYLPYWRFDTKLDFKLVHQSIYLYEVSVVFKNVAA